VLKVLSKTQGSFAFSQELIINQLWEGCIDGRGGRAKINSWKNYFLLLFPFSPPTLNPGPANPFQASKFSTCSVSGKEKHREKVELRK
jgi:hypothetical protein